MQIQDTALVVIDVQESFRQRDYWTEEGLDVFVSKLQALIMGAEELGIPVVRIFHVAASGPFSHASGLVRTMEGIQINPTVTFEKSRHSALTNHDFLVWLRENGIRRLLVSGIRTEQCCETTARHAADSGFLVDYVSEATLTFPMVDRNGRKWYGAEIKERTELVLEGRFARIVSVEEALQGSFVA